MENNTPQKPSVLNERTMIPAAFVITIVTIVGGGLIYLMGLQSDTKAYVEDNYVRQIELAPIREDIAEIKSDVKDLLKATYKQQTINATKNE